MLYWLNDAKIELGLDDLLNESRILFFSYTPFNSEKKQVKNFSALIFLESILAEKFSKRMRRELLSGNSNNKKNSSVMRTQSNTDAMSIAKKNALTTDINSNVQDEFNKLINKYFITELDTAISTNSTDCKLIILPRVEIREQIKRAAAKQSIKVHQIL